MPVSIQEKTNQTVIKINTAKILNINIDVENRKLVYVIGFGIIENNKFIKIKSKTVVYSGEKFIELAESGVVGAKNMYDNISESSYAYLQRDGHLEFNF